MSAMDQLKALEARVKSLEVDEEFGVDAKVRPPPVPLSQMNVDETEYARERRPCPSTDARARARDVVLRDPAPRARLVALSPSRQRAGPSQLKKENERLTKENETIQKLLLKERYRIKHLIRTVESLSP